MFIRSKTQQCNPVLLRICFRFLTFKDMCLNLEPKEVVEAQRVLLNGMKTKLLTDSHCFRQSRQNNERCITEHWRKLLRGSICHRAPLYDRTLTTTRGLQVPKPACTAQCYSMLLHQLN